MIAHDRLFKELLTTFFVEFIELLLPEVVPYLDKSSLVFLDKEIFSDITRGEVHEVDLLVRAKFKDSNACFLIHTEAQAHYELDFGLRLFRYFARLRERLNLPVFPVVVFSFDTPMREQPRVYDELLPWLSVLHFEYRTIQLNRLKWRSYLNSANPIAAALMAKMQFARRDRPLVKLECLRMMVSLKLNPARSRLISGFVDSYLKLTAREQSAFDQELATVDKKVREDIMEIVTSWMEDGIKKGHAEGRREADLSLVTRLLNRRFGSFDDGLLEQVRSLATDSIEDLAEALLDFNSTDDLQTWLSSHDQ